MVQVLEGALTFRKYQEDISDMKGGIKIKGMVGLKSKMSGAVMKIFIRQRSYNDYYYKPVVILLIAIINHQ